MICVGIDVAKDKHDCFILNSEGEVLADVFTIPNNAEGFEILLQTIRRCTRPADQIKVGLEATGHYSYNILRFLLNKGLTTFVINPLHTNLYRKSLSLRKTKTDRVDARTIAAMLMSDVDLKSYTDTSYHSEELKSLTRYRFDKVRERAKLKQSVSRLATILFPELEKLVPTLHMASVYALLSEFPGAIQIAAAHLTLSPSTYQSGQLTNCYSHMEKRGSRYLRYAIFNATKYVCHLDPIFAAYLSKKRSEGKHYNVAISHAAKKLVRLIYAMEKSGRPYRSAA